MGEFLREKTVKVRKTHSCFSCGNKINVGEKAIAITYVDEDGICTVYECKECIKFKGKHCKNCNGEINGFSCYDEHEGCYWEDYIYQCKKQNFKEYESEGK